MLHAHLEAHGVVPLLYATDWFMCLFVKTLPWESVLRLWDMFLFEGVKVFYRAATALVQLNRAALLACTNMGDLMMALRNLPPATVAAAALLPALARSRLARPQMEALQLAAERAYDEKHAARSKK